MQKILLALLLIAAATPALAQQVPMASTDNPASSFIERNGDGGTSYSDPSAQVAPGKMRQPWRAQPERCRRAGWSMAATAPRGWRCRP